MAPCPDRIFNNVAGWAQPRRAVDEFGLWHLLSVPPQRDGTPDSDEIKIVATSVPGSKSTATPFAPSSWPFRLMTGSPSSLGRAERLEILAGKNWECAVAGRLREIEVHRDENSLHVTLPQKLSCPIALALKIQS